MIDAATTRTKETEAAYLKAGLRHLKRAKRRRPDLRCPADVLVATVEEDTSILKRSTTRVYKQELTTVIDQAIGGGYCAPEKREEALRRIEEALLRRRGSPVLKRTSSRKAIDATPEEVNALRKELVRGLVDLKQETIGTLLPLFVFVAPLVGIRPGEWRGARVEGTRLVIICAKATNGRSCAERRVRSSTKS